MKNLNWNRERWRTRDRLLEYDFSIVPSHPHTAGLSFIYPWENINQTMLSYQLYEIAKSYGFSGTSEQFLNAFGNISGHIIVDKLNNFPIPGDNNNLYFDEETEILYYYKQTTETIIPENAALINAAIVGQSIIAETYEVITHLYIPIRALLIESILFDCGDAAEYID